jgi:hypothetical protein
MGLMGHTCRRDHKSHESHRSHPCSGAAGGATRRGVRTQRVEDEDEHEALGHADEVEKETGPEVEHAAPGVANFAVAGGSQETGSDIVIDLLL